MEPTFKPGMALHLTVRVTGGIEYHRTGHDVREDGTGRKVEAWETEKITANPEEHAEAVKLRANIRNQITRKCARTPLGDLLLIPDGAESDVTAALDAARESIAAHNATAKAHHVTIGAVLARFVPDDKWTVRSIRGEIMACLGAIEAGIGGADVKRVREACDAIQGILPMLTHAARLAVEGAVEESRRHARALVRRIEKNGEDPAQVIPEIQAACPCLDHAKLTFLDVQDHD